MVLSPGPLAGSELQSLPHQAPYSVALAVESPALGPPVLPPASNTEFKFSAQVEKDPNDLLLLYLCNIFFLPSICPCFIGHFYLFIKAAITKYHIVGVLNNKNLLPHNSGV